MSDAGTETLDVLVVGAGVATVVVGDRELVVRGGGRELAIPIASLDGLVIGRDARGVALHARGRTLAFAPRDDAPETLAAFDALARRIAADAFALPEVMRGLRAYGSSRARPGSDHDRFFAPLVAPLRALRAAHERLASGGSPAWRAVESLDATRAAVELRAALAALAAERCPESPPDRRALEAELADESEELHERLDALTAAAQRLHVAPDTQRVAAWRAWTAALTAAFDSADRCWARSLHALGAATPAPPPPSRWRRGG